MNPSEPNNSRQKIIRVIASYLRVSTEDQRREGFSIENQREANLNFIHLKFGKDVEVIEYIDVESGYSIERQHYLRMMQDCRSGKIDGVVVWREDRFTRKTIAGLKDLEELTVDLKILAFSVIEGEIDLKDAFSRYMTTNHLNHAEYERNRLMQRVMPGMRMGARQGHYQGTRYPFLGTTYDKGLKQLKWVKNEVKMLLILFRNVAKGDSIHSVCRYLTQNGYTNRKGKPIGTKLLCDAIKREIYCDGYYRWNGIISEKPVITPIIDRAMWEKANKTVASYRLMNKPRSRLSRHNDSPFILQGVLQCIYCGANLVGHPARLGIRYYACGTYLAKTKAACRGQWVKSVPIEEQALAILKPIVSDPFMIGMAKEQIKQSLADRNPDVLNAIRQNEMALRETKNRFHTLFELRNRGAISLEQFTDQNKTLLEDEGKIKSNLKNLEDKRNSLTAQTINTDRVFKVLENFDLIYDQLSYKAKKTIFNSVFKMAHAVSEGKRKPKYIRDYELNDAFKFLTGNKRCRNQITTNAESSNIQSRPLAAR